MIVYYLNFEGIGLSPAEADPPLVVDPNAVLSRPIASKGFQPISRNLSQIGNGSRRLNVIQFTLCHYGNSLKLPAEFAPKDLLGFLAPERPDHTSDYYRTAFNAIR
jgi:hypothetical protein